MIIIKILTTSDDDGDDDVDGVCIAMWTTIAVGTADCFNENEN